MFSKFGSGSVRPCQIFGAWLIAMRFEPNFGHITSPFSEQGLKVGIRLAENRVRADSLVATMER